MPAEFTSTIAVSKQTLRQAHASELRTIKELVRQNQVSEARERVVKYCRETSDHSHPEIVLSQLMLQAGQIALARQTLEQFSVDAIDRLDLHLAFCQLAFAENRWFDAYILAKHSVNADAPLEWTEEREKNVRDQLLLVRGACCEKRSDWKSARLVYSTLKEREDPTPQCLSGLARCEFQLANVDLSLQRFGEYQQAVPTAESAPLMVARLFSEKADAANAEKFFRLAISKCDQESSDDRRPHLAFSKWLIWNNRPDEAKEQLKSISGDQAESTKAAIQYLAALVFRMESKYANAERILFDLHKQQPDSFPIANQLALVLIENSDEAMRSRALQIALTNARSNSTIPDAWSTLGWIQFRLGDAKLAEQNLLRSMQNGVAARDAATYLSLVKKQLGQSDAAAQLAAASDQAQGPRFYFPDSPKNE